MHTFIATDFPEAKFCSQFACQSQKTFSDYMTVSNSSTLTPRISVLHRPKQFGLS